MEKSGEKWSKKTKSIFGSIDSEIIFWIGIIYASSDNLAAHVGSGFIVSIR